MVRIRAGLLVDGTGAPPLPDGALLARGERILEVGPDVSVPTPDGATLMEFPGGTLLPGLVDCHSHLNLRGDGTAIEETCEEGDDLLLLRSAHNARAALESGTTTLRDHGAAHRTAFSIKRALQRGIISGPRLLVCGRPLTVTGGHCWTFGGEADGAEGVRHAVRQLLKEGADFIKVMITGGGTRNTYGHQAPYTLEELRAAVEEAHAWGRTVAGHAMGTAGIVKALEAGFDMVVHCYFYDQDGRYAFRPDLARRIADRGVWVNPTLHVQRARVWQLEQSAARGSLTEEETAELERLHRSYRERCHGFQGLLAAGARVAAGSDAGWGYHPFGGFAGEPDAMAEAGMAPADALHAATMDSARALGLDRDVGSLQPGKLADLLVVEGDPTRDVAALGRVKAVFLEGKRVR